MTKVSIKTLLLISCLIFLSLQDDDLTFTCAEGKTKKVNPDKTPTPNGCGGSDTQRKIDKIINPYRETLTTCCNTHDICFNTCYTEGDIRAIFNKCNTDFKKCMYDRCKKKNALSEALCKAEALALYNAVKSYGDTYFKANQKVACMC
jgi:hypothetical protein